MLRSDLVLVGAVLVVAGLTSGILFAKEVRTGARLRLTGQAETMILSLTDQLTEEGGLSNAAVRTGGARRHRSLVARLQR